MTNSPHEWEMHKIWEVTNYVYMDGFEHLDQPECNHFLHFGEEKRSFVENVLVWLGTACEYK